MQLLVVVAPVAVAVVMVALVIVIVVVVMDFMAQVQTHLMSHQYEGLMKKANLKSSGNSGLIR